MGPSSYGLSSVSDPRHGKVPRWVACEMGKCHQLSSRVILSLVACIHNGPLNARSDTFRLCSLRSSHSHFPVHFKLSAQHDLAHCRIAAMHDVQRQGTSVIDSADPDEPLSRYEYN